MKRILLTLSLFITFSSHVIFAQCPHGTDDPPGCLVECAFWSPGNEVFSVDAIISAQYCTSDRLTRWFKVRAASSVISVSMNQFNCTSNEEISVRIFSSNLLPVSPCQSFDANDFSGVLQTSSVLVNREYFVRVESSIAAGCDFELFIEGNFQPTLGNTPPPILQLSGDSLFQGGRVFFNSPANYQSIIWSENSPNLTIESGQGTTEIVYSKPRYESIEVCAELFDGCGQIVSTCETLPSDFQACESSSSTFPGCEYECSRYWAFQDSFHFNSTNNNYYKWFEVEMADSVLRIFGDEFNCSNTTNVQISVYDNAQNLIDTPVIFNENNFINQELKIENLSAGEKVSILMEAPSELGCDFSMFFDGVVIGTVSISANIRLLSSQSTPVIDGATVVPVIGANSYNWSIPSPDVFITSGQGTDSIVIANPDNLVFEVCVTPVLDCGLGFENCELVNNLYPGGVFDPCPPFSNASPGASPPGCRICSSTVIANNSGYGPGMPFNCGISHNSTYQYMVADSSGFLSATFLATDCQTGDGLQLIIFDGATGAELGCFSSPGAIAGNVQVGNLVPGNIYIIMIDGFNADVCQYTLIIQGGATTGPPDPPGPIRADPDTTLCPGAIACYEIDPVIGADIYNWTLPQNVTIISGGGLNNIRVCVRVDEPGGGVVQVVPSNACFPGVPAIKPLVATPIVPAFWPPMFICQRDMPWDTSVCGENFSTNTYGGFDIACKTALGCDSLIKFNLIPKVQVLGIIDTTICNGGCVFINGVCYEEGGYELTLPNSQFNGCDSILTLVVRVDSASNISSDFNLPQSACEGEPFRVEYLGTPMSGMTFNWDFGNAQILNGAGAGPYDLAIAASGDYRISLSVSENGCTSMETSKVISISEPLIPLSLTCISSVDEVRFNWVPDQNVSNYSFNVTTGQSGFQNRNSYIVSNLNPNETVTLEVTANSIFGCQPTVDIQTCQAQDCPTVDVTIDPVPDFCLDAGTGIYQLNGSAGNNTGTFTWSGPEVSAGGSFNVAQAGSGNHVITLLYQEGICTWSESIVVNVTETPTSDFNLRSVICVSENAEVNYTGFAPNANYSWDFGDGVVLSGANAGPYQVSFPTAGPKTISLVVEENGCFSSQTTKTIVVEEELATPIISCDATQTNVTFSWAPVSGATDYTIVVNNLPPVNQPGTSFPVTGLNPGENVRIKVTANTNSACGASMAQADCIADGCPTVNVIIDPVSNICLTANAAPIQLSGNCGTLGGTCTWSGPGVDSNGQFNPQVAGVGTHTLQVEFIDGTCMSTASTTVNVYQLPTADFNVTNQVCQGESIMVNYMGNATSNANFNWDFGNGVIQTGANGGPYELQFDVPSTETISLSVEENGCTSAIETQTIEVNQALMPITTQCVNALSDQVTFEWNTDVNVNDYQIQVLTGQMGSVSGNSYTVTGLSPGEMVTIEIEGISANACPSITAQASCESSNCPPIDITFEPISTTFCMGDSSEYQLIALLDGAPLTGNVSWSGTNISSDGKFNSAGLSSGNYTAELTYDDGMGCVYSNSTQIEVVARPELMGTVTSPIWKLNEFGKIDLMVNGGTPPYNVTYPGNTSTIDSLLPPGEYCYEVADENNCMDETCFQINEGIYTAKPVHIICQGEKAPLFVSPSSGATFEWTPRLGLSCTTCPNPIADPGKSSIYTVTATLPSGQSASQNISIIVLPSIICNLIPKQSEIEFEAELADMASQIIDESDLKGIEEKITNQLLKKEVKVVPNPTGGQFELISNFDFERVEVFDFSGKKVEESIKNQFDLSHLSKGVYFLKIKVGKEVILKRVILI